MTDRPTPEEIAEGCERETTCGRQLWAIAKAIEAERAEADRRVAEERAAVVRWLRENEADLDADAIERGEHRK